MPLVEGGSDRKGDSEKKQVSAVVWVFLAVAAVLAGVVAVVWLLRSRADNPFAVEEALQVIQGVAGVVGTAGSKVESTAS